MFVCLGNAILTMKSKDAIKVLSVRGTSFEPDTLQGGSAASEKAPEGNYNTGLTEFIGQELSKSDRPELTNAKVVISGGTVLSKLRSSLLLQLSYLLNYFCSFKAA